jgi:hypothetical protein
MHGVCCSGFRVVPNSPARSLQFRQRRTLVLTAIMNHDHYVRRLDCE